MGAPLELTIYLRNENSRYEESEIGVPPPLASCPRRALKKDDDKLKQKKHDHIFNLILNSSRRMTIRQIRLSKDKVHSDGS